MLVFSNWGLYDDGQGGGGGGLSSLTNKHGISAQQIIDNMLPGFSYGKNKNGEYGYWSNFNFRPTDRGYNEAAATSNSLAEVSVGSGRTWMPLRSLEDGTFSSWYSNRYGQFDSQIEAYRAWQANPNYHEGESFWDRTFRSIGYATMEARRDYASGGSNMFGGYGRATVAAESVWTLGLKPRGLAIEAQLGGNLPASFPTIDRFADGVATSIKSIDLTASSYQNASSLTSLVNGYINKVAEFSGANWGGVSVQAAQIQTRVLNIAIPQGAGNVGQMGVLQSAVQNGASRGVTVLINVIR
jgi:hypothetical protein